MDVPPPAGSSEATRHCLICFSTVVFSPFTGRPSRPNLLARACRTNGFSVQILCVAVRSSTNHGPFLEFCDMLWLE